MKAAPALPLRGALGLGALALALHLSFVLWAPGQTSGDARWYHTYAAGLARGAGYIELDGSPAVQWLPGWPLLLSAVYRVTGPLPRAGMVLNAGLAAAATFLLVLLGTRLFRREIGLTAGALFAVWPGWIFFSATLMTETAFSFFLLASLAGLAESTLRPRPAVWCAGAGLGFGAAALTKGEPLLLTPVVLLFLWISLGSPRVFVRAAAAFCVAAALLLAPWTIRNYAHFDRLLVTSASGGINAWIGNHDGATGGEMALHATRYAEAHRGANRAETSLAANDAGWRDARRYVRSDPAQAFGTALHKLRLTYGSDDGAVRMIRGVRRLAASLDPTTARRMATLANAWWWSALALAAIGLTTLGGWRAATRVIVLGLPATWLVVHAMFLGGARFHVPEIPAFALVAACGLQALVQRIRRVEAPG